MMKILWMIPKFLYLLLLFLLMACGQKQQGQSTLPVSKGLPNELLLIVDEAVWESSLRDSIEGVLKSDVPGLSQSEPLFRMMRLYPQHFTPRYSTMRNIVEIRLNKQMKRAVMRVTHNVKAKPQIYVSVFAPNLDALATFLKEKKDEITKILVDAELNYEAAALRKKYSKTVDDAMQDVLGCSVRVPSDLKKVKKATQFVWASTDRLDKDMNFVAYSLPFENDAEQFMQRWVDVRDSVMRVNIPGSTPEKWMMTTKEKGRPLVITGEVTLDDGRKLCEMRGLWEMRKGAIGGPFVSLAYPDTSHQRMLVVEGFVYSPNTAKRDLIRRMEVSLRTVTFL